jgi:hypothetical protein
MAEGFIPLGQWSGSDATKQLEETIKRIQLENSEQQRRIQLENSKQQETMLWWTVISAVCAGGAFAVSLIAFIVSLRH